MCVHMDIGVRDLKQHLSAVLDRVSAGESVYVTDRGRRKAVIQPTQTAGRMATGIAEGWIRPAVAPGMLGPTRRWKADAGRPATTVLEALADDRLD
jgi:prevent-host-death family protein